MSSDFLQRRQSCVDDDINGSTVLVSMKASGDAFLTVLGSENAADYHLPPNEIGWQNAEKIVEAIKTWIEHTKIRE